MDENDQTHENILIDGHIQGPFDEQESIANQSFTKSDNNRSPRSKKETKFDLKEFQKVRGPSPILTQKKDTKKYSSEKLDEPQNRPYNMPKPQ